MIERYEKNGKVAVLYSPGYGAGWSTWNPKYEEYLCFDKNLVEAVLNNDLQLAQTLAENHSVDIYTGGAEDLKIKWVEKGTKFEVREYDGYETIEILNQKDYLIS